MIARRLVASRHQMKDLIDAMRKDKVSSIDKIEQLRVELSKHHNSKDFLGCKSMGAILRLHLKHMLSHQMKEMKEKGEATAIAAGYVPGRSGRHGKR